MLQQGGGQRAQHSLQSLGSVKGSLGFIQRSLCRDQLSLLCQQSGLSLALIWCPLLSTNPGAESLEPLGAPEVQRNEISPLPAVPPKNPLRGLVCLIATWNRTKPFWHSPDESRMSSTGLKGLVPPSQGPALVCPQTGQSVHTRLCGRTCGSGQCTPLEKPLPQLSPGVLPTQRSPHSFQFHPSFPFSHVQDSFARVFSRDSANSRVAAEGLKSLSLSCPRGSFPKPQSWPLLKDFLLPRDVI